MKYHHLFVALVVIALAAGCVTVRKFPNFYTKDFPIQPTEGNQVYTLSGGEDRKAAIDCDDDLTVLLNGETIFADNDGRATLDHRPGSTWKGTPITFHARRNDKITIVLYDMAPGDWGLGPLYLHSTDCDPILVLDRVAGSTDPEMPYNSYLKKPPGANAPRNEMLERTFKIKDVAQ